MQNLNLNERCQYSDSQLSHRSALKLVQIQAGSDSENQNYFGGNFKSISKTKPVLSISLSAPIYGSLPELGFTRWTLLQ